MQIARRKCFEVRLEGSQCKAECIPVFVKLAIYTNNIVSDSVIENPWLLRTVSYRAKWHVRNAINNRSITHDATNQCGLAGAGWANYGSDSLVNGQVEILEDRVRTQRPGNVNAFH